MALKAGFSEIEITPPPRTEKAGWLRRIVGTTVLDPFFARAVVFECGGRRYHNTGYFETSIPNVSE